MRAHGKASAFAVLLSIALWFIPFAGILTYPFRIFVTFIHEGGHALVAVLTGNTVSSLSVAHGRQWRDLYDKWWV